MVEASIILLTKNAGDNFITLLLERLFSQELSDNFEVIVIDSGSVDNTLEIAENFNVRNYQIESSDFHHGKTRNLGADLANGKFLVYLSQDAMPTNNHWLRNLIVPFDNPNVAMTCGRQIPWQYIKPPEKFFRTYHFPEHRIIVNRSNLINYHDNIFISDVNSAYRHDTWNKFRFSEEIGATEDREISDRLLATGWSIAYEPEAAVYHAHNLSIREVFKKSLAYGASLRQGARDSSPISRQSTYQRLLSYSVAETRYLRDTKRLNWLPYCLVYDLSQHMGTFLGKYRK